MIKILFLGEVIGIPTVKELRRTLKKLVAEYEADFVIANADGASDGYGLLSDTAYQLHNAGVNVLTSGDFIFNKKDIKEFLSKSNFILRPFNLPKDTAGRGYLYTKVKDDVTIGVINILGRTNFNKIFASDPFHNIDKLLDKIKEYTNLIIVDFHGGTTSEIQAMFWYLNGKVSFVAGTHQKVLTADARIIDGGTAVITGSGYCGAYMSVSGLSPETEIKKIKTGQFTYSKIAIDDFCIQGSIVELDEKTGKAISINLLNKKILNKALIEQ
jgi:2',3'-cyclic-nucleotide 2'-phosphodiesterase